MLSRAKRLLALPLSKGISPVMAIGQNIPVGSSDLCRAFTIPETRGPPAILPGIYLTKQTGNMINTMAANSRLPSFGFAH
jgi:hypothetical protein